MNKRFLKLTSERQHTIVQAVIAEVADKGFDQAAVAAIAERAGMSKPALFYYFADRTELLATGLTRWFEAHTGRSEGLPLDAIAKTPVWTTIDRLIRAIAERVERSPVDVRFGRAWIELAHVKDPAPALAPWAMRARAVIDAILQAGIEQRAIRADLPRPLLDEAALALALTADRWLEAEIAGGGDARSATQTVLRLLRSSFEPIASEPAKTSSATKDKDAASGDRARRAVAKSGSAAKTSATIELEARRTKARVEPARKEKRA